MTGGDVDGIPGRPRHSNGGAVRLYPTYSRIGESNRYSLCTPHIADHSAIMTESDSLPEEIGIGTKALVPNVPKRPTLEGSASFTAEYVGLVWAVVASNW